VKLSFGYYIVFLNFRYTSPTEVSKVPVWGSNLFLLFFLIIIIIIIILLKLFFQRVHVSECGWEVTAEDDFFYLFFLN